MSWITKVSRVAVYLASVVMMYGSVMAYTQVKDLARPDSFSPPKNYYWWSHEIIEMAKKSAEQAGSSRTEDIIDAALPTVYFSFGAGFLMSAGSSFFLVRSIRARRDDLIAERYRSGS